MTTLRIAIRNKADFENALGEQARLFEARHPGVQMATFAAVMHSVVTRALGSNDATMAILEDAQQHIDNKGMRFS